MALSKYILDIFDLTFQGLSSGDLLTKQIPFLSQGDNKHTGIGLYIYFVAKKEIQQYKVTASNTSTFDANGNVTEMLNGVEIRNSQLNILADATVHLKGGIIDNLEIWNKNGHDYPQTEPKNYELHQTWLDLQKRRTIIK